MKLCRGLALIIVVFWIAGCGGSGSGTTNLISTSPLNGIYRTSFTRGNSAVTVYVNFPEVEVVVFDEANQYPSFVGSSTTLVTTSGTTTSFTSLPLVGSDGETALASGTFVTGTPNTITLTITGGIGFSGAATLATTSSNTLYSGTYSGTYLSTYKLGTVTTSQPTGAISSLTLAANPSTGGYTMNATGSTYDPTGASVTFTISNAQVDPAGIVSNLSVVYSYPNSSSPSVTTTFSSAYIDLGVVAATTLLGYQQATTTGWPNGALETDSLVLTQSSTTAAKLRSNNASP